jgi:biopolymer transport protein ExbD
MKNLFKKKRVHSEEMTLQITSMADIFTILLVFLLKSFSTGAMNVTPSNGVMLPEARAQEANFEALKVEISSAGVQIEGESAVPLNAFHFDPSDLQKNGSSRALQDVMAKHRARQLAIAKGNSDVKVDPRIIVISDQRAPYESIKTVLASAALNGYTDFKLAVVKGD